MSIKHCLSKLRSEDGAVTIVEASYVFPIMFYVIFFLIFFGNMYYVKASVDSIVSREAIKGAQYYANPWVKTVNEEYEGSKVPEKNNDVKPYRQLTSLVFQDKEIQNQITAETNEKITALGGGAFAGMEAGNVTPEVKYTNHILYSTFTVAVDYKISFPIRFIGDKEKIALSFRSRETVNVTDNTEFVRNVDMVIDYMERSKWFNELKDKFNGLKEKIQKFL